MAGAYADGREARPSRVRTNATIVEEPVAREGRERVEEDDREEVSSRSRVILAPLGVPVTADGKRNMREWEAARESFIKKPDTFPATLGFEAWASLMSFDVSRDDGGSHFQALMRFMLTSIYILLHPYPPGTLGLPSGSGSGRGDPQHSA